MTRYKGEWSQQEVKRYLDDTRAPMRLSCLTHSGGPWMLSLWFKRDRDTLICATSADARVVEYLSNDPRIAFEISTNDPPYKGVRGSGRAEIVQEGAMDVLEQLIVRYLGGTDNSLARFLLQDEREEVAIFLVPKTVYSWDFTGRMKEFA